MKDYKTLTREKVDADPGAARYMGETHLLEDWSDKLLDLVLNGPTLNGFKKDEIRAALRQTYTALKQYEQIGPMASPYMNDPLAIVARAFAELYPGIDYHAQFVPDLCDESGNRAFGLTIFPDDNSTPIVCISAEAPISAAPELLAHELAHVATPEDRDHGEAWKAAEKAIGDKYDEILNTMIPDDDPGVLVPHEAGDGGILAMPLRDNIPDPGRDDWTLTTCPVCGGRVLGDRDRSSGARSEAGAPCGLHRLRAQRWEVWKTKERPTCRSCHFMRVTSYAKVTGNNSHLKGPRGVSLPHDQVMKLRNKPSEAYQNMKEEAMELRAFFDNTHNDSEEHDIMTDVWRFPITNTAEREDAGGHATPKPIALCERAILSSSRPGELVVDFFGGSGSTLIACENTGRTCAMIELEPKWCDVIVQRYIKTTGDNNVRCVRQGRELSREEIAGIFDPDEEGGGQE